MGVFEQPLVQQKVFEPPPVQREAFEEPPVQQEVFEQPAVQREAFEEPPVQQEVFEQPPIVQHQEVYEQPPPVQNEVFEMRPPAHQEVAEQQPPAQPQSEVFEPTFEPPQSEPLPVMEKTVTMASIQESQEPPAPPQMMPNNGIHQVEEHGNLPEPQEFSNSEPSGTALAAPQTQSQDQNETPVVAVPTEGAPEPGMPF